MSRRLHEKDNIPDQLPDAWFNAMVKAALEASAWIMKVYEGDFHVQYKEDHTPVTIADKGADDIIREILAATGIPVISEEHEVLPYNTRKDYTYVWIVDPLDGTREFIKRNGQFTVNIGLVYNHTPVAGIVTMPVHHEIYIGWPQSGARKAVIPFTEMGTENFNNTWKAISHSLPSQWNKDPVCIGSRSHRDDATAQVLSLLQYRFPGAQLYFEGSSVKFCRIAEGSADVYPRIGRISEWDMAASHAILLHAGACIRRYPAGISLAYNKPDLRQPPFIAYGSAWDLDFLFHKDVE